MDTTAPAPRTARVTFKAKVRKLHSSDGTTEPYIDIPTLTRSHCDMHAFRMHPKHGGLVNSDLFPNVLAGIRRQLFGDRTWIRLSEMPAGVAVDTSGFLAVVSFDV